MKIRNSLRTAPFRFSTAVLLILFASCSSGSKHPTNSALTSIQEVDETRISGPEAAIDALQAGNTRFVEKRTLNQDFYQQIQRSKDGQKPYAIVLSCLDSRIPPEIIFDQGIGDIFVARVAGNIVNEDILGSMEFGAAAAGAKAIVVLGHTRCGAVKGACEKVKLGNLTGLLKKIEPSVSSVAKANPKFDLKSAEGVDAVALENVKANVKIITAKSPTLRALQDAGKLKVVGAMYDLASGTVTW